MKLLTATTFFRYRLLLPTLISLTLTLLILLARVVGGGMETGDLLLYRVNGNMQGALYAYDSQRGLNMPIIYSPHLGTFRVSINGRLAFSTYQECTDLYILDDFIRGSFEIIRCQNTFRETRLLAWSPDGRYLAFMTFVGAENAPLYIWDGKEIINIMPDHPNASLSIYDAVWSSDGRLAFSVESHSDPHWGSEIYVWDGQTSINLSQNFDGLNRSPAWSSDGRLAFIAVPNQEAKIVIWDGVFMENGMPNAATYRQVALEVQPNIFDDLAWTPNDQLTLTAFDPLSGYSQIYLWDGQNITNISQNPSVHNGLSAWSADGRWAFGTIYFSTPELIHIRDQNNQPLLAVEGHWPAWSSDGKLMFCRRRTGGGWLLMLWDGSEVITVAEGYNIQAQWQSGASTWCSSG